MSLEQDLRRTLGRRQPPAGFDERLRSRVASASTPTPAPASRWRTPLALAASILLAATTVSYVRQRELQSEQQRHAAEQTVRNVTFALRLTSEALETVRTTVKEVSQHEP